MKIQTDRLGKVSITVEEDYWNINRDYDKLVIVEREGDAAYLSRKPVPTGTYISNRKYWIKLGISPGGGSISISQSFGNDPNTAISQKTITNRFNDIQSQIDAIIGSIITIEANPSVNEIVMGTPTEISIPMRVNVPVTKFTLHRIEVGDEPVSYEWDCSDNPSLEHTFTDEINLSRYRSKVQYVAEVIFNGKVYNKEFNIDVVKKASNVSWGVSGGTFIYTLGGTNVLPTLNHAGGDYEIESGSNDETIATVENGVIHINNNNKAGQCTIWATTEGNDIYNYSSDEFTLSVVDSIIRVDWSGASVSPDTVSVGSQATINKGTIKAVYSSGKEVDVTASATLTSTKGTISGNVFTANAVGTAIISASYGGKTASNKFNVTVESVPAYIGAGTSAQAVAVAGNVQNNYGSGSQQYSIPANDDDYIYILLPSGTPFYKAFSGGQEAYFEKLNNMTIGGHEYEVRRTGPLFPDTYVITIQYVAS